MVRFFCICLLTLLSIPQSVFAQFTDFQTWSSITIEKSLSKKLDGSLEQQLRLDENSTQFRQTFTELGAKYRLWKKLDAGASYRFIVRPNSTGQRIYLDVEYNWKLKKWKINPRLRYQHDFITDNFQANFLRPKLTISYKIDKKWEPFVAGELFYLIFYYQGNFVPAYRLFAGTTYDFNKRNSLKVFYLLEQEVNVNNAAQNHIISVGYKYDF